jgi:hypothetical protein
LLLAAAKYLLQAIFFVKIVFNYGWDLNFKVLSSEMDPSKIRFIRKDFIKERGAEAFQKNQPVPHPVRARKIFCATSYICW